MKMYTKDDIIKQLKEINAPQNKVVLMHTSLRSIGNVEGGGEGLLDILIDYFTKDGGLLCIPTHTWDNLYKQDVITLDMLKPESNLGAFTNIAANDPRGIRSLNPTHSMVVFGNRQKALEFIEGEQYIDSPTAPESCYGKIYSQGGYILLAGVAQDKNTYLHCVAQMLNIPNRMDNTPIRVTVRTDSKEIINKDFILYKCDYTDDISLLFPKYETAFRYHKGIKDGFLGSAPVQLCDAVILKQTVELIFKNSGGEDPLKSGLPIPPALYCTK